MVSEGASGTLAEASGGSHAVGLYTFRTKASRPLYRGTP